MSRFAGYKYVTKYRALKTLGSMKSGSYRILKENPETVLQARSHTKGYVVTFLTVFLKHNQYSNDLALINLKNFPCFKLPPFSLNLLVNEERRHFLSQLSRYNDFTLDFRKNTYRFNQNKPSGA